MERFVPRHIDQDSAAQGYNNEGRGKLIGYAATPSQHEVTCRYRISTSGYQDKKPHEVCSCRLGLWQDETIAKRHASEAQRVMNEMRGTPKRKKPVPSGKTKAKRKAKSVRKSSRG